MTGEILGEKKTNSKWYWLATIVVLGILAVYIFVRPVGEAGEDVIPVDANATDKERLDTELSQSDDMSPLSVEDETSS